jgi:hypothetical protein
MSDDNHQMMRHVVIDKHIERANLIIHKLLGWFVFLQQTKELDNVGILFVSQSSQLCNFEMHQRNNILTSVSNL